MFGTSGIRGPVGDEVTADLALAVGRALGSDTERVTVGRDPRESGRLLTDALTAGLRETGTDVLDLGLAATPTVARAIAWYDADAGVSITASHNPPADNGIKLWQEGGQAFDGARRAEIERRVRKDEFDLVSWNELGTRTREDATDRHVDALLAATDLAAEDVPAVAIDLGNGAGGVTIEALSQLGCGVETLNAQPDGEFPARPSEPNEKTLRSLSALVAGSDAEVGLAHDGDADRLVAIDGDGEFVPKDALLAIFAGEAASEGDRIACPVDTSLAVEDYLAERGIGVTYTPVGDVHVAEALGGEVTFGGEPSGAWIWPGQTRCPDGPLAACRLVALCTQRPLAERVGDVPAYPIERANVEVEGKEAIMDRVRERALEGSEGEAGGGDAGGGGVSEDDREVRTLDGVRIDTEAGWYLVRASGTQPLIRVTAEAREADRAARLSERGRSLVENARG
ncbi:phosphoglucosamine mutase [Halobacteriales archaeon QS_3_64_16]|nr:MAG: phosphoglucosamine mutase [Halobacteriales archaeon QS_3_64_16]